MEEEKTLEEKVEVAEQVAEPVSEEEPEPISDEPGAEVSSEAPETQSKIVQELADEVKACFATGMCQKLGRRFDEVAKQLDIGVDALIDEVFALVKGKKAEQTEG